jgi:transposase
LPWEKRIGCLQDQNVPGRAVVIQTLLGTAKLNGLDPADWLKDTLEKLPTWPNGRSDEPLPWGAID